MKIDRSSFSSGQNIPISDGDIVTFVTFIPIILIQLKKVREIPVKNSLYLIAK